MRSFLLLLILLLLSLMTGCEAWSTTKGCQEGWVEFTCKYPKPDGKYQSIDVVNPKSKTIRNTEKAVWEEKGRVSLYHDTTNKNLRVAIKQLEREDFGDYKCEFHQSSTSPPETEELELDVEDGCQKPFIQTAYRTAKTTITCDYPGNKNNSKFFCKENGFICEEILSTKSSLKSNGTFTLTETNSGFNVSISDVSSHHAGVYWCGGETNEGSYRAALRKITLEVKDITTSKRSPAVGQTVTYWCRYPTGAPIRKFICKGEDPSICQRLVSTTQLNNNTGRFSMKEDKVKRNITITVREVTTDDTGSYWCGAESTDNRRSNSFFTRFLMTVVSPTTSTIPSVTSSPSLTQPAAVSYGFDQASVLTIVVALSLDVLLLLLMLTAYFVYTRFAPCKNTRTGA